MAEGNKPTEGPSQSVLPPQQEVRSHNPLKKRQADPYKHLSPDERISVQKSASKLTAPKIGDTLLTPDQVAQERQGRADRERAEMRKRHESLLSPTPSNPDEFDKAS